MLVCLFVLFVWVFFFFFFVRCTPYKRKFQRQGTSFTLHE